MRVGGRGEEDIKILLDNSRNLRVLTRLDTTCIQVGSQILFSILGQTRAGHCRIFLKRNFKCATRNPKHATKGPK